MTIPALTLITDSSRYPDDRLFSLLEELLPLGLDAVLLREKSLSSAKLLALASRLRALTSSHGAALYVHTQADVASAVAADGVHVASGDIANIPAIRSWLNNPALSVSASCHTLDEIRWAESSGADFIFLSPLFPTESHPGSPHLGVAGFQRLAMQTELPVIALGGIDGSNCTELPGTAKAVIGSLLGSDKAAEVFKRLFSSVQSD